MKESEMFLLGILGITAMGLYLEHKTKVEIARTQARAYPVRVYPSPKVRLKKPEIEPDIPATPVSSEKPDEA